MCDSDHTPRFQNCALAGASVLTGNHMKGPEMYRHFVGRFCGLALLVMFASAVAFSPEFRGSITGKVTDPNYNPFTGTTSGRYSRQGLE